MNTSETKSKFIELRAQGFSFDKISKKIEVSKKTLIKWDKKMAYEVSNAKSIELEVLQEKFWMKKQNKIELFGNLLQKINEEIESRDFKDIPTDKLLELQSRYIGLLDSEFKEIPKTMTDDEIYEAKQKEERERQRKLMFDDMF